MEWKVFCSFFDEDAKRNCTEAAVGEVEIVLENKPKEGAERVMLPICQKHLDKSRSL